VEYLLVLALGLVAGTLSGIVGFGSSIIMMPALVIAFGPLQAVPVMATAAVMVNFSRILVWWRDVDWRLCATYALTGVPSAALGARTLLLLRPRVVETALGLFFIAMIPTRRWLASRDVRLPLWALALIGAVVGFVTGIVVSTGPITAPIFLLCGLTKGAFLGTEAAGSLAVYVSKASVFRAFGALPIEVLVEGLITGSSLMVGSFIAKRFVLKLDAQSFRLLMDALMLASGVTLLWTAVA
jgi:uncharacterized protein